MTYQQAHTELLAASNPKKAELLKGFFKAGKGEYAEGDRFLGVMVPTVRGIAKRFQSLSLSDTEKLVRSSYNEERLLGLLILVGKYKAGDEQQKVAVFQSYVEMKLFVNNWNLVDGSAPYIVGSHLLKRSRGLLYKLSRSRVLWDRRIAIVSTLALIRQNEFQDTLKLSELLLDDEHDLMHKACGWMLREVGKRNVSVLEGFLKKNHVRMPRTMLRYAIERFPEKKRKAFLVGKI